MIGIPLLHIGDVAIPPCHLAAHPVAPQVVGVDGLALAQGGTQLLGAFGTLVDMVIPRQEIDHHLDPMVPAELLAPWRVLAENGVVVCGFDRLEQGLERFRLLGKVIARITHLENDPKLGRPAPVLGRIGAEGRPECEGQEGGEKR